MKKIIVAVIFLSFFGLFGWKILVKVTASDSTPHRKRGKTAVAVTAAEIRKGEIRDVGLFTGSLYPAARFLIAPKIAGRLEKILVNIGDSVEGGRLVAVLDSDEYRQQVMEAQAALDVAKASLLERTIAYENAHREYERTGTLRNKKIASASQLDAAEKDVRIEEAKLKLAEAQVAQKSAALKIAEVRLSETRIHVPETQSAEHQVVGERFVDAGALLAPNMPIVSVLDIGTLTGVIHVIERDYAQIRTGMTAVIETDAWSGRMFSGQVMRIAPLLKETSREARVEIDIPNPEGLLKPGMYFRAQIQFAVHENTTLAPAASIVKRNGKPGVFHVDRKSQTARFVPVTIGIRNQEYVEILSPAVSGSVVVLGHHLLEDGSKVALSNTETNGSRS